MGCLMNMLENYPLGDYDLDDEILWIYDEDRGFSVTSMYDVLCP